MTLIIRMGLYLLFGGLAGHGVGTFDIPKEAFTITVEQAIAVLNEVWQVLGGLIGFYATWRASRRAKAAGGET